MPDNNPTSVSDIPQLSTLINELASVPTGDSLHDIQLLLIAGALPNPSIQESVLSKVLAFELENTFPILAHLATSALVAAIRQKALAALLPGQASIVRSVVHAAAADENVDLQLAALRALSRFIDEGTTALLADRMLHSEAALPRNDPSRAEEVRVASVDALGVQGRVSAVVPLVSFMLANPQYRPAAARALVAIGSPHTIESLLDACDGNLTDASPADVPFLLEAAKAIAAIRPPHLEQPLLDRYRALLASLYLLALQELPTRRYILEESARNMDIVLLQVMRKGLADTIHTDPSTEIVSSLRETPLELAEPIWLDILEVWPPHLQDPARAILLILSQGAPKQAANLVAHAFGEGGAKAHPDRLPAIVSQLEHSGRMIISKGAIPLLELDAARPSAQALLHAIWTASTPEEQSEVARVLLNASYTSDQSLRIVSQLLAPAWAKPITSSPAGPLLLDQLLDDAATTRRGKKAVAIIKAAVAQGPDIPALCEKLTSWAVRQSQKSAWAIYEDVISVASAEERVRVLSQAVHQSWSRQLLNYLLSLSPDNARVVLQGQLSQSAIPPNMQQDLDWAVSALGKCGHVEDFPILVAFLSGRQERAAIAAIRALAIIDADAAQPHLCEALRSRKPAVVLTALDALSSVGQPRAETARAVFERSTPDEPSDPIRKKARSVHDTLRQTQLALKPPLDFPLRNVQAWLVVLEAFGPSDQSSRALSGMLDELSDLDAPDLRLILAHAVRSSALPDIGIQIAERELTTDRNPEIREAWAETLDALKGAPERGVFRLVERVSGRPLDRASLLGDLTLDQLVLDPSTVLSALSNRLRKAERVLQDADTLITVLDGTAELLVDELLVAAGEDPQRFGANYANKVGRLKAISNKAHRHADTLHTIREGALDPHSRDSTGAVREGLTSQDAVDGRTAFGSLFEEVVTFLRARRENS